MGKSRKDAHESYVTSEEPKVRVSRGSFYNILKKITSIAERMLKAVQFVSSVLVNDPVATL